MTARHRAALMRKIEAFLAANPPIAKPLSEQIAEDTCEEHGVFLCEKCFDLSEN